MNSMLNWCSTEAWMFGPLSHCQCCQHPSDNLAAHLKTWDFLWVFPCWESSITKNVRDTVWHPMILKYALNCADCEFIMLPSWPQILFAFPKIPLSYVLFAVVTGSSGSELVCAIASTLALVSSFRPFSAPDVVVSAGTSSALPRSCRFSSLPWLELLIPMYLGIVQNWNETSSSQL